MRLTTKLSETERRISRFSNTPSVTHTMDVYIHFAESTTLVATMWDTATWTNTSYWAGAGTIITGMPNIWGDPDFVDYLAGDFHVGENSAAKDKGIDVGVTTYIAFHPRPYQTPDIGADEYWLLGALKFIYLPSVVR